MNIIGEESVKNHNCIIIDDMIDTAGSIAQAANALKKSGAKDIYCTARMQCYPTMLSKNLKRLNLKKSY